MSEDNKTANMRTKNALCYIPLAAFFIHFTETKKTPELKKHIKYGIFLFIGYSLISFLLGWLIGGILFILYIGFSGYLGYRAYNGEEVDISFIDNFDKNKTSKKKNNSSDDDEDILNF